MPKCNLETPEELLLSFVSLFWSRLFLGCSGSGRPRSRSRLRVQAKKAAPGQAKKGQLQAAAAPDIKIFSSALKNLIINKNNFLSYLSL